MPVLINAFGSEERMAAALGVERLDELGEEAKLLDLKMPGSLLDKTAQARHLSTSPGPAPKRVSSAPCQEVVETDRPSLAALPILCVLAGRRRPLHHAARWCSRAIPSPGARNVGMYRLQVYDDQTLGMHWQTHKGGAEHQREARRTRKERMPVAIALGGDPATIYAGSAPLPPGSTRWSSPAGCAARACQMVPCKTVDLEVPAQAEIVLEGWVDPAERRLEGPFGDHTGYYSLARDYPVFHLKAVTRRATPDLPDHHRRAAAAGGLLARQGHRADLPADHPD